MENNIQYKAMESTSQIRMKLDCVPTKFQCQSEKRKQSTDVTEIQQDSYNMNIIQQRHKLIRKNDDKESIFAKENTEDSWSEHRVDTFSTQAEQKVSAVDIEHNMLLVEDDQDMTFSEDTKKFIQQWNSDVLYIVCRICLAVDTKMYNIGDYKLKQSYLDLTGLLFSQEDMLPNMLCWECVARLQKANRFRDKALRSYNLLLSKVKTKTSLSISDVQSIDRVENGLQTSLAVTDIRDSVHAAHGDDVIEVKQEVLDEPEVQDQQEEPNEEEVQDQQEAKDEPEERDEPELDTEVFDPSENDPLDIGTRPASSGHRRRGDETRAARTKSTTKSRAALDSTIFDVVEVPLQRALAEAAQRAARPEYRDAEHRCDRCYKVFATPTARLEHALRHSEATGEFECAVCRCRWRSRVLVRKHFTESHAREHICRMCPFTTRNRSVAKRHEGFHKGVKFQCSQCHKEFVSQTAYLTHQRLNHVCRYPCARCGFAFPSRRGVALHTIKTHKRDQNAELTGPYCAACDVRFATDDAHDRHLQLTAAHLDDNSRRIRNDYHIADKRMCKWKYQPRTQSKREKSEKSPPVRCEQCGAECAGYRAYAQHFRSQHPGGNRTQYSAAAPAMCEHCGKIFHNSYFLRAHASVHENGSRASTSVRDTSDARGRRARTPRRTHACPHCPKRFTVASNRSRHVTTIHQRAERRFRCAVCDKRFAERSSLQIHYDHVHLKKPWPKRTRAPRPRPAPATGQELESTGKDASTNV